MKNCTALAATLSANFLSNTPYQNGANLTDYLQSNGVLLTMCMDSYCAIDPNKVHHISASWINANIGFSTVPGSLIGYILDPYVAKIKCLYPTDGATLARDGGCGPAQWDPLYGSQGYRKSNRIKRYMIKQGLEKFRNFNFDNIPPEEIPCDRVYHSNPGGPNAAIIWSGIDHETTDYSNLSYATMSAEIASWFSPFLGYESCAVNDEEVKFDSDHWLAYFGEAPWKPNEWKSAINHMEYFESKGFHLWNEIVLDLTPMKNIVSAVFFIIYPGMSEDQIHVTYQRAKQESRLLERGQDRPLIVANLAALPNGELFTCVDDESWNENLTLLANSDLREARYQDELFKGSRHLDFKSVIARFLVE